MKTHSSILAQKIPWTEETSGLQSIGLQRAGHDLMTEHEQEASLDHQLPGQELALFMGEVQSGV